MGTVRVLGKRDGGTEGGGFERFLSSLQHGQTRIRVELNQEPYWIEQGWKREGYVYKGMYKTSYKECKGEIVDRAGAFDVYIFNPPLELKKHKDWHCFIKIGFVSRRYKLHLTKQPKDVSSAIFNVQRIIEESFRLR